MPIKIRIFNVLRFFRLYQPQKFNANIIYFMVFLIFDCKITYFRIRNNN